MHGSEAATSLAAGGYQLRQRPVLKRLAKDKGRCKAGRQVTVEKGARKLPEVIKNLELVASQLIAYEGVGQGLAAKKVSERNPVFRRGERILSIAGPLALRVTLDNGKTLEWLYHNKHCLGLTCSSKVLWSNRFAYKASEGRMELGVRPNDLSVYANDSGESGEPNAEVTSTVKSPLPGKRSKKVLTSAGQLKWQLVAKSNIPPGREITWSYGRMGKDDVDYGSAYQEHYRPGRHDALIKQCTEKLLPEARPVTMIDDLEAFNRMYWQDEFAERPYLPEYTEDDLAFLGATPEERQAKLRKFPHDKMLEAYDNESRFKAYIKLRLSSGIQRGLNAVRTMYNDEDSSCTFLGPKPVSSDTLYGYCVDKKLLIPEDSIQSLSLVWIAGKLSADPGNLYYQKLVIHYIRYRLVRENPNLSALASVLNRHRVPNVFSESGRWRVQDFENLTGIAANTDIDSDDEEITLEEYSKAPPVRNSRLTKTVYSSVRRNRHKATLTVLKKTVTKPGKLAKVAKRLQRQGASVLVDGAQLPTTAKNVVAFVREHMTDDQYRMLRPGDYSDDELIDRVSVDSSVQLARECLRRVRQRKNKVLFIRYLKACCEKNSISRPHLLMRPFRSSGFVSFPRSRVVMHTQPIHFQ